MNERRSSAQAALKRQGQVRAPKTAELVARRLRSQILRKELREGDLLPAGDEMMEHFGISRPILREAFRILESESLITVERGARGGARVHNATAPMAARYLGFVLQAEGTTLVDLYQARILIEPAAVRQITAKKPVEAAETLRKQIETFDPTLESSHDFAMAMFDFHSCLVSLTSNRTLTMMMTVLNHIFMRHVEVVSTRAAQEPGSPAARKKWLRALSKLATMIERGDAVAAEVYWREHLEITEKMMLRWTSPNTFVELLD